MVNQSDFNKLLARVEKLNTEVARNRIVSGVRLNVHSVSAGGTILQSMSPQLALGKVMAAWQRAEGYRWMYACALAKLVPYVWDGEYDINADFPTVDVAGATVRAWNVVELNNPVDKLGIHGNGVDTTTDLWTDNQFEIMPCPAGTSVIMWRYTPDVWLFSYANGVDGACG